MSIAATLQAALPLPDVEKKGNFVRTAWDRLRTIPGGRTVFTRLIGFAAPYTGTIGARVLELRDGYSRVELRDRRKVRNHIDCVHAIALANLAELTANVAVAYTLPDDARFIVKGLSMEYLKKARGTIYGSSTCPIIRSNEERDFEIEVSMHNRAGDEVARAVLQTLVGPKRAS